MYYLIGVSEMAKHNATGRNKQPSLAQRQQALARATQSAPVARQPEPTPPTVTALVPTPVQQAVTTAEQSAPTGTVIAIATGKGAAMRDRWSKCLKARPGASLLMPAEIKGLPKDSLITALVPGNPKRRGAADRYEKYGFNMIKGATTTIGKYVEAVSGGNRPMTSEGVALADIAWDINHGFIQVDVSVAAPKPVEEPTVLLPAPEPNVDISTPPTVAELPPLEQEPTAESTTEEVTQETVDAEPIDPTEDNETETPRPTDAWATVNEPPAEVETEASTTSEAA